MRHESQRDDLPPIAVDAVAAAKMLGISHRTLIDLAIRGDVPTARIGRRRLFPIDELRRWLSERAKAGSVGDNKSGVV